MEGILKQTKEAILTDAEKKSCQHDDGFGGVTDKAVTLADLKQILDSLPRIDRFEIAQVVRKEFFEFCGQEWEKAKLSDWEYQEWLESKGKVGWFDDEEVKNGN